jgi:hypothetical protein
VDGQLYGSALTFFREEDRLPELLDSQFPRPAGTQHEYRSARAYRHPFLSNAVGPDAPLRVWFKNYCIAYRALQAANPTNLPDLEGCRFYFDSEPTITWAGSQPNCVFMLRRLADENPETNPQAHLWWSTKQVPGYPNGTTLASLYAQEVARPNSDFPANILDPNTGLEPGVDSNTIRNRKFMLWYAGVCDRARDAVYKNCFYDVVHEFWPTAKCLNYSDARLDNLAGPTGWFMDWNNPATHDYRVPKNQYPRAEVERWETGGMMYGTSVGRYQTIPRWTSGEKDSPVLYNLTENQWLGQAGTGWGPGTNDMCHQQPNLYLPPVASGCNGPNTPPCETLFESTMRLSRHSAESCINSVTGFPGDPQTGGHEDRFTPWLQLGFGNSCNGTPQPGDTITHAEARDVLAMLRAKNIREAIYWLSFNPQVSPSEADQAGLAWFVTGTVIKRVYATRIVGWTCLQGAVIITPGGDTPDAASLEFALSKTRATAVEVGANSVA